MTTSLDEVLDLFKQIAQAQQEVAQAQKETEIRFQETDRCIEQVHKQLSREIGNLGGAWGRFVENMVAPACETIFLNRGIPVHQVSQRVKKRLDGKTLELDILAG